MAALHGTKPVDSAENALVVKFADGKGKPVTDGMGVGVKRGSDADSAGLSKRANLGMVCSCDVLAPPQKKILWAARQCSGGYRGMFV